MKSGYERGINEKLLQKKQEENIRKIEEGTKNTRMENLKKLWTNKNGM